MTTQWIIQCASDAQASDAAADAQAGSVWGVTYTGTAGSNGDWFCMEGDTTEVEAVVAARPPDSADWASGELLDWSSLQGRFALAILGGT